MREVFEYICKVLAIALAVALALFVIGGLLYTISGASFAAVGWWLVPIIVVLGLAIYGRVLLDRDDK